MSRFLERLENKKLMMQKRLQKGRMVSEKIRAEKIRCKKNKIKNMKPGAVRAILEGLATRDTPMGVMRKEWERRKKELKQNR